MTARMEQAAITRVSNRYRGLRANVVLARTTLNIRHIEIAGIGADKGPEVIAPNFGVTNLRCLIIQNVCLILLHPNRFAL
jgi:hypothetical protein